MFGFNPIKTLNSIKELPSYFRDLSILIKQKTFARDEFPLGKPFPCFGEKNSDSGTTRGHYFHQDLLVARRIYKIKPSIHVDVGSRIDGFVAHVASFRPIYVFDIRPVSNTIPNVNFVQADLQAPISENLINYCDSLSCLHVMEHFGLGRYGDPINYYGHILGLKNLQKCLKKGGKLFFSVPIGRQRIEFNAHRVFSVTYLLKYFKGIYQIDQFSFVNDQGNLHENVSLTDTNIRNNFGCVFGCGIFEMTKL